MPTFALNDATINYKVVGEGPAIMFLSATAWPGNVWERYQVPEFSRDHKVIIFDQRGTGASRASGLDFSTQRLAADAAALLDHLNIPAATICGHSNGGRVAQLLALDYPEKVSRLVLLSAGGTHKTRGIPIRMIVKLVEQGHREYERTIHIETGCSVSYYAANRDRVDAFIESTLTKLTPLETMLRHVSGRQESDTTARLGEIRVPTLVVVGDDETHGDTSTSHLTFARLFAERIPQAQFSVLQGQGHLYPFYEPELTNSTIRAFLESAATLA